MPNTVIKELKGWIVHNYESLTSDEYKALVAKTIPVPSEFLRHIYKGQHAYITVDTINWFWSKYADNYSYPNEDFIRNRFDVKVLEMLAVNDLLDGHLIKDVREKYFGQFTVQELVVFYFRLKRAFVLDVDFTLGFNAELESRMEEVEADLYA